MLVAEHESLVTQFEKLADLSLRSVDKEDWLSDLSYGAPPRMSSSLSFRGCQGHSSLDAPSELNLPQKIPSPLFVALLVPQAEG